MGESAGAAGAGGGGGAGAAGRGVDVGGTTTRGAGVGGAGVAVGGAGVNVGVTVGVDVNVAVGLGVKVAVGVEVGTAVGVGGGVTSPAAPAAADATSRVPIERIPAADQAATRRWDRTQDRIDSDVEPGVSSRTRHLRSYDPYGSCRKPPWEASAMSGEHLSERPATP